MRYGYKLSAEGFGPKELVRQAKLAEASGFDFVEISDHYHPWLESQGHSPFTWTVLGAIAASTESIRLATGVTCPTVRYHPAIIAQAAATLSLVSDGRFTLGLGSGERLNEHVVGRGFPAVADRSRSSGCCGRAATSRTAASTSTSRTRGCSTCPTSCP
jgi:G6PDH family F420-dependent oxidoreductase